LCLLPHQFESHHESEIHALWDTAALNNSYLQLHEQMTAWLARAETLEPEAAARESFILGSKAIKQVVFDPLLPEPFVDVAARHAFVEMTRHFDQVGS
jgi:phenylacetic acid degradation operon negative regulatory protein